MCTAMQRTDITWDKVLKAWIYDDSRSRFPQEQDRHYTQQQRLWKYDNINFELGGTSNVAANETSETLYVVCFTSILYAWPTSKMMLCE